MDVMVFQLIGAIALGFALMVFPRPSRRRRAAARRAAAAVVAPPAVAVTRIGQELDDEWDDELGWVEVPARTERRTGAAAAPPAGTIAAAGGGAHADGGGAAAVSRSGATGPAGPEAAARPDPDATARQLGDAGGTTDGRAEAAGPGADDPHAPLELEDDDWHVAPPPVPGRRTTSADSWNRGRDKRRRGPLRSPVVLLALYSAAGIALIVLAVNLLSGSFGGDDSSPVPAADRERAEVTPAQTPVATATPAPVAAVSDFELQRREAADAAARRAAIAAERRATRSARAAERRRIAREQRRAARERREAARRLAARRRAAAPSAEPAPAATPQPTPAPVQSAPPPAPVSPPSSGGGGSGGGGGGGCEFCIE